MSANASVAWRMYEEDERSLTGQGNFGEWVCRITEEIDPYRGLCLVLYRINPDRTVDVLKEDGKLFHQTEFDVQSMVRPMTFPSTALQAMFIGLQNYFEVKPSLDERVEKELRAQMELERTRVDTMLARLLDHATRLSGPSQS
jgi:hypothetical protein